MSDEDWAKLFDLIHKVVHAELTAAEKANELQARISHYGADGDCSEFAAMLIND
jgi:hypothetical protein